MFETWLARCIKEPVIGSKIKGSLSASGAPLSGTTSPGELPFIQAATQAEVDY